MLSVHDHIYVHFLKTCPLFWCKVFNTVFINPDIYVCTFIIKFPYNTCSGWLKRATSKNRVQVDDVQLALQFLLQNFDKCDPHPRSIFSE